MIPAFVSVRVGESIVPVLLGVGAEGLLGFDPVGIGLLAFDPDDVEAVVSLDPVAVFYGADVEWSVAAHRDLRAVANRARFAPRGKRFELLPEGVLSGYPVAEHVIRRHRMRVPSEDAIRVSSLFAVSTVRTPIEQAEKQFDCFGDLYRARGRQMPALDDLRDCFVGLQNQKTATFAAVAAYASTVRAAMRSGLRDRALRRHLALEEPPPEGLGLAKLSFTLALLGQDTICLDSRLLGRMFPQEAARRKFDKGIEKRSGRFSEKAVALYEAAEDAFLDGNPHYDRRNPVGRARAQWTAWEAVGGRGAEHRVWLNLLA